jgi:hypothetical protein
MKKQKADTKQDGTETLTTSISSAGIDDFLLIDKSFLAWDA